jgi:hypothetical protein
MQNGIFKKLRHSFLKEETTHEVSVLDPDPHGSALILFGWIRIRAKKTLKREKSKVSCFDVLDVLF